MCIFEFLKSFIGMPLIIHCLQINCVKASSKEKYIWKVYIASVMKMIRIVIIKSDKEKINLLHLYSSNWTCGAMDNAPDYGSGDSRFESWQVRRF